MVGIVQASTLQAPRKRSPGASKMLLLPLVSSPLAPVQGHAAEGSLILQSWPA